MEYTQHVKSIQNVYPFSGEGVKIDPLQVLEREIFIDNLLVRVHLIIEMSRPALRHGRLNSLFQVACRS